jgi:hypothetical protein
MSKRIVVHVVPGKNEGWDVKKEGEKTPLKHFEKKDNAIDYGKSVAKQADLGQIKIHTQDGKIQTEHTYGNDPRNKKG